MIHKFDSFVALAKQRYRITLTSVEEKLLKAIVAGEVADYQVKSPELTLLKEQLDVENLEDLEDLEDLDLEELKELEKLEDPEQLKQLLAAIIKEKEINNPAQAKSWGKERILSAEFIEWLCTDVEAFQYFTNHGLQVCGAKISGKLNLEFVKFESLLYFTECVFTEEIVLKGAKVEEITFDGSHVVGIDAELIEIRGSLYLINGFQSKGEVSLSEATIGGQLLCSGGHFFNKEGYALNANNIEVKSHVSLRDGFKAEGTVNLYRATIGGSLICLNSYFSNPEPEKYALVAEIIEIKGSVFLRDGFKAEGKVSLLGAIIGGQLDCSNGHFSNPEGNALFAESIEVKADVILREHFQAQGRVSLLGAIIGGQLECRNGHFSNPQRDALVAQSIKVRGHVLLGEGFEAEGEVSLSGANISGQLDCIKGHFSNPGKDALNAQNIEVNSSVFLSNDFKAEGRVSLAGANISGVLDCSQGHFSNQEGDALFANNLEIKGSVFLRDDFKAEGRVSLHRATIGGQLDCSQSHFSNQEGDAFNAESIEVKGSVFLSNCFQAEGRVSLSGATIGGKLASVRSYFSNQGKDALFAESIEVKDSVFLRNGFKAEGRVSLSGANIGGQLDCSQGHFSNQEGDALFAQNIEVKTNIILSYGFKADGKVDLTAANIKGNLDCTKGNFSNKKGNVLSAEGINVDGDILLDEATFKGKIYLVSARVDDTLSMLQIQESQQMKLDLQFARIGRLTDDEQSWPQQNNLNLDGFIYQKFGADDNIQVPKDAKKRLQWLRLKPEKEFFPQTYEQLAEVLKKEGDTDAATEILIHKERDIRPKLNGLSKFWNGFLDFTIVYGYKPTRALFISGIFIAIGYTLFGLGYYNCSDSISNNECLFSPSSEINPYSEDEENNDNKKIDIDYPEFNFWLYSLDTFIPIVDLHQQTYWLPNPKKTGKVPLILFKLKIGEVSGRLLRWYLWFHIVFGWILTSLWVAGFSGLVRG